MNQPKDIGKLTPEQRLLEAQMIQHKLDILVTQYRALRHSDEDTSGMQSDIIELCEQYTEYSNGEPYQYLRGKL